MSQFEYATPGGIRVRRTSTKVPFARGLESIRRQLDSQHGIYLSSGYEYPGRYSRWDIASICPPLEITGRGRDVRIRPLNARGEALTRMLHAVLKGHPHFERCTFEDGAVSIHLHPLPRIFPEEQRSKQPSVFSLLRALVQELGHPQDSRLALVGAFGYDLLFQFDPIELRLPRDAHYKDLHLFLCDDIYFMDRKKEQIERFQYDFERDGVSTAGLAREGVRIARAPLGSAPAGIASDHTPEEYMAGVERVREGMRQGEYYEVILRQTFSAAYNGRASELFEHMQRASPSPYEFLLQLGDEQLIGASPEMFVRVEGRRVETCPISGTARRTGDPLHDAAAIRELLNSLKDESELTMCTDVDRNDKSRVCEPGSVRVLGRRLIESYAGLFHTVDHVEGTLQEGFDSLDAFLTHMWAVTIIGAPKKAAAQAIENLEKTARGWYGGAIGMISLNGDINTGILIRTVHLRDGIARYPAGATLLYDSVPEQEEAETRIKATGFFRILQPGSASVPQPAPAVHTTATAPRVRMLLVDNDDCFIHTLANYARQTGAEVVTYRAGIPHEMIRDIAPDLILISPGPGRPSDFGVPQLVRFAADNDIPVFGVCLGLQGIVEAFGGELGVLDYPMHGKASVVTHDNTGVFEGLPAEFRVGRYHSLYAVREKLPPTLRITAESNDGVIMGVRHRELRMEAVQFHPESILSLEGDCGLKLMRNVIESVAAAAHRNAAG